VPRSACQWVLLGCLLLLGLGVAPSLAQQQPPVSPVLPGAAGAIPYYAAPGGVLSPSTAQTLSASSILTRKDAVTAVAVNTTLGAHNVVQVTVGSSGVTLTLPAAATTTVGSYRLIIADTGVGLLTLAPTGTDKLNGVNAPLTKTGQYRGFEALWLSATDGWYVRPLTTVEATGGGSGTPGGASTQLQFNNAGAFGGIAPLTWDGTHVKLAYNGATQLRFTAPNSANAPFVMNYVQNINPGEPGRPDDTFQWGYNRDPSGAKINNAESAFSYHLETHWTDPSYGPTMEHYLVSNGINGVGRRIFFLQTLKSTGAQTIPWMWGLTNGLGMQWNSEDLQTYWAQLNETGLNICATCTVSKSGAGTDILVQDGTSLIRKENATDITVAPGGGNVILGTNSNHTIVVGGNSKFVTNAIFGPNGPQILEFGGASNAVNYYFFGAAATGNYPEIRTLGSDAAVGLTIRPQGTGPIEFQISGNNNAYFSSGGARFATNVMIGPANYSVNASETLRVYNKTATTGVTKAVIQAGEGQGTANLQEWRNNADTVLTNVSATGTWTLTPTAVTGNVNWITAQSAASVDAFATFWNIGTGNSKVQVLSNGADASMRFSTSQEWGIGSDRSDNGSFKIANHENLGTNDRVIITAAGAVTITDLATTGAATGKTAVCADTAGRLYRSSASGACLNSGGGGGGGTPGGSSTQLQYNNAGSFGGVAPLTWDGTILNLAWASGLQLRFGSPDSANSPFVFSYTPNTNPGEPTRTDDTFVWGSNRNASGGRLNAGDAAFTYHLETHWTDPSFGPTMEHYISSTGINGANRRVFFLQTLKSTGAQTTPWMWGLTNGLGMTWNSEDLGTFWAGISQTGMSLCDTCTWNKQNAGSDILVHAGSSLIRKENASDISIAPAGGNIILGANALHTIVVPGNAKFLTNGIYGPSGTLTLSIGGAASAVNYYDFSAGLAGGDPPEIKVDGGDANIGMTLRTKGTGTASIQVSGNNNGYFSSGGIRLAGNVMLGPANYNSNASETLRVYNNVATTGVTKAVIQAGAGQSTTNLQEWRDNNDTILTNVTATGGLQVQRHVESRGTTPAVAGSCGSSPAIVGTDVAGKVTTGTGSPTSCTITFASAWTNAPACMVTNETTASLARAVSTTTTVTLSGTLVAGDVLAYICFGRV